MATVTGDIQGCGISRGGGGTVGDPYTYTVDSAFDFRPVNYVSWCDAARFANWLHNGQTTGAQDSTTTEDGAYLLNGATSDADLATVTRDPDWKWAITSEDEWYKAAYHKNDGVTANYYNYPTSSDSVPGRDMSEATNPGNNSNYRNDSDPVDANYPIDDTYYTTVVGEFEDSDSPYGTFDQGGNLFEWNEAIDESSRRGRRGGSFLNNTLTLHAAHQYNIAPAGYDCVGFRVSEVPEPAVTLPDTNNDGVVNAADYITLKRNMGQGVGTAGAAAGDFNKSGTVDFDDLQLLLAHYGESAGAPATIPEPATLGLLAIGAVALLRRRRRS